jgi:hypothetical protein
LRPALAYLARPRGALISTRDLGLHSDQTSSPSRPCFLAAFRRLARAGPSQ